jgi:hypothetical protein
VQRCVRWACSSRLRLEGRPEVASEVGRSRLDESRVDGNAVHFGHLGSAAVSHHALDRGRAHLVRAGDVTAFRQPPGPLVIRSLVCNGYR